MHLNVCVCVFYGSCLDLDCFSRVAARRHKGTRYTHCYCRESWCCWVHCYQTRWAMGVFCCCRHACFGYMHDGTLGFIPVVNYLVLDYLTPLLSTKQRNSHHECESVSPAGGGVIGGTGLQGAGVCPSSENKFLKHLKHPELRS